MQQEIKLLDVVALLEDIPEENLLRGESGTVVEVYEPGVFLVEFANNLGQTHALPTLNAKQLLLLIDTRKAPLEDVIGLLGEEEAKKYGYLKNERTKDDDFHTVEYFRKIKEEISKEIEGMNLVELKAYLKKDSYQHFNRNSKETHEIHYIEDVKVVGDHALELTFEDGLTKQVDFTDTFLGRIIQSSRRSQVFSASNSES